MKKVDKTEKIKLGIGLKEPSDPRTGDVWVDTENGMYIYDGKDWLLIK